MKDFPIINTKEKYPFLSGGGEMGALIREHNWSTSSIGEPQHWHPSLRITLGIILHSAFPMFLFWGKDLICFYNDSFRPSLGIKGKHPSIGKEGKKVWPEIWDFIGPLIDQVMTTGKPVWFEDQLVPFFRNGKVEDIYWTFSYSAVNDDSGKVMGVLVTCTETTDKIHIQKQLEENERRLKMIILQAPVAIAIFKGPNYIVEIANSRALELWRRKWEEVMNKPMLKAMPELIEQGIKSILDNVYKNRTSFSVTELPVQISKGDKPETIYVNFVYEPLYDVKGTINGIMAVGTDVTSHVFAREKIKENEEKLKESAERLTLATEGTKQATWDLNLQTNEIIHSPRLASIFGYPEEQVLTHTGMLSHLHEDDSPIVKKAFDLALRTGSYYYEARITHSDKTIHWIRTRGTVIYDDKQLPLRMLGTIIDITDYKIAEENVAKMAAIVHSSDDAIISKSLEGIVTTWNAAAERIFGYKAEEMIGQPLTKLFPDDRMSEEPNILDQLKKGMRVDHFETKRITKDKKILDVSLTISPIRDLQGNIIGASKIARDITKQKQIEKIIKESEEKFRLLADSIPQLVWTGDAEGNLNYFSQSVYDYSGLTPTQIQKDGWLQIVHPDEKEDSFRMWQQALVTGTDFVFEHRFLRHDGEYRWQLSRAVPQKDAEGNIQMWVGSSTDIQEMKELDQQKDYFISMASHELKTPITSVKGYIQILQSMYHNTEDTFLKNSLNIVDKQILTLTKLISDLLDLSKIKSGNLLLNKEQFGINELITEILQEMKHINPDYTIAFSAKEETNIFADRERIGQVLINFLTNAVKYSPNSHLIKVESLINENDIIISVEDAGIGINKIDQEKIFERFYRVEGKNEKTFPGFGIGLFIASEIIHRHNGKIGVTSEPGKGSVFYFSLSLQ
ncbi:MAG: PAS domain S-box protein [Ferruginibacter sp.]